MLTAVLTVILFLILIIPHEFGHFITAKLMNVQVNEFSVGMGPALFQRQKGETLYSLRAIPLGGYCKFEGEDEESDDPRAFSNRPVWQRIIVVAAGGLMNILLGFVIFLIIVANTSPFATNVVEEVVPNSYIESAGLMPGDKIVAINGKGVSFYSDIALYASDFRQGEEQSVTVKRNGEKLTFKFKPSEIETSYTYTPDGIEVKSSTNGKEDQSGFYPYSDTVIKDEEKLGTTEKQTRLIIGFRPHQEDV